MKEITVSHYSKYKNSLSFLDKLETKGFIWTSLQVRYYSNNPAILSAK